MKKKITSVQRCNMQRSNCYAFLTCLLVIIFNSLQAQVHLVKDIKLDADLNTNEFWSLTDVNGTLFFVSKQNELWRTDGTTEGSIKIKTFLSVTDLKNVDGTLFFFAVDDTFSDLWKSDGTESGTIKVKEKITGSSLTVANGLLYFVSGGAKGLEVWRSDGTSTGTFILKDIIKGGGSSNPTNLTSFNNKLYFVANNGTNGYELWESDGTTAGTHLFKDIIPGKTSSAPNYLTVADNTLFLMARDAALGQELWKSDGTVDGTVLVKDVRPGSYSSFPTNFISVNNTIYFRANDGVHGFELWKSDGTAEGTALVIDIEAGKNSGFSWINGMIAANDFLYFILGRNVYKTDGTPAGTQNIFEIEDFYNSKEIVEMNGSVYIVSTDYYINELWRIDGTTPQLVYNINAFESGGYFLTQLTSSANTLYFIANGGDDNVISLWKSDGTHDGTVSFLDLFNVTASSYPNRLTDVNGTLYFTADSEGYNTGLWKSNGTEAGTQLVSNTYTSEMINFNGTLFFSTYSQLFKTDGTSAGTLPVTTSFLYPGNLTVIGNVMYFKGDQYPHGYELWKTDGTQAGTVQVKEIYPGAGNSYPENLTNVNGLLYFTADNGITGRDLWKSDGTSVGTVRVKDFSAIGSNVITNLTAFNNELYFVGYTTDTGFELWKSNGTESGTVMVKDINTDDVPVGDIGALKAVNGVLYFTAIDAVSGWALWKSDGTPAGTVKVKDFYPGLERIYMINSFNNELYVLVTDETNKNPEIWKSDGTEAGTVLIKRIGIELGNNPITSLVRNGHLYINLLNSVSAASWFKYDVWLTDGTTCGTFRVDYNESISQLTSSGSNLFGVGMYEGVGIELLRLEETEFEFPSCAPVAARAPQQEEISQAGFQNAAGAIYYPNPFQQSLSLRVNGKDNASFTVRVINVNGQALEDHRDLKCNVDYTIGANWREGIYLLKIEADGKPMTYKVMKVK
jgi:ELWxxDGT repeat protein